MQKNNWRKFAVLSLTLTGLVGLAGCAPGASTSSDKPKDAVSTSIGTDNVTLNIATTPDSGGPLKKVVPAFEKAFPNVKVNVTETAYDDYNKALPLQLDSEKTPDVALVTTLGTLAKDGLLENLNPYIDAYTWSKIFSPGQLGNYSVGEDMVTHGGATTYALPAGFYTVGLYVNNEQAKKAGITTQPKTLEELEANFTKAKDAGLLPLQFGNAQGHSAFTIEQVAAAVEGAQAARDWVWGKAGSSFDSVGNKTGVAKLIEWRDKGFYPSATEVNGTGLSDALKKFTEGQGTYFLDGNWDAATVTKAMGANASYITFPGTNKAAAGGSLAYAISAKSKIKNVAAAFLNFMSTSPISADATFELGLLPPTTTGLQAAPGVNADILASFNEVADADGLLEAYAGATASMNDTFTQKTQELIAGKISQEDFIAAINADWNKTYGK